MPASVGTETWVPGLHLGRYVLLRELARGGMAEIWLAQQPGPGGFNREVVIKRILPSSDEPEDFEKMFFDEARIAAQLSHPNIVQMFEFSDWKGTPYLVMEHLAGETLSRLARSLSERRWRLPHELAVFIVLRCAEGLGYAHRKCGADGMPLNVVHRDVSPQNVFVTYDGLVKVLDFGIARAVGRSIRTQTGVAKGKAAYMPPEQARGGAMTASADVFALGVVLYELLSGQRLYANQDSVAIFTQLVGDDSPYLGPAQVDPSVPAVLDRIVERALSRDPAARQSDGVELADELAAWLGAKATVAERELKALMHSTFSENIRSLQNFLAASHSGVIPESATPLTAPTMPGRTPQSSPAPTRRPVPLALALLALALLAAGLGTAAWLGREPAAPRPQSLPVVVAPAPVFAPDAAVAAAVLPEGPQAPTPAPVAAVVPTKATPKPRTERMLLNLNTTPWTSVYRGKSPLGDTPLVDVALPAGRHQLRLVNEPQGIDVTVEVEGRPGERVVKNLSF